MSDTSKSQLIPRVAALAGTSLLALAAILYCRHGGREVAAPLEPARFVGASGCGECHAAQVQAWRGSHHALAMQAATAATVLGDFRDAAPRIDGATTRFYTRAGDHFVLTIGPDGKPGEFRISYTLGVYPLQQYLIELPRGRLQALGIAWDARPNSQGGQRWFSLYPGQRLSAGDALHWTGREQNWNYQCAACHTTNLAKHYTLASDSFATTWTDGNVACEACHGPASAHVAWARGPAPRSADPAHGFAAPGPTSPTGQWALDAGQRIAHWSGPERSAALTQTCYACHARRRALTEPAQYAAPEFLDGYAPTLIQAGTYQADGQVLEEDFEYGSFLQSRMARRGVVCADCHDAHGLELKAPADALCLRCHRASVFATSAHHHHDDAARAPGCIQCHMPQRTYMIVHTRHDHSFRVPRPDLSSQYGVANSCTDCHRDRTAAWAADIVARWYGPNRRHEPHFAAAFHAADSRSAAAASALVALAADGAQAPIVRASALARLADYPDAMTGDLGRQSLRDPAPLVRAAAASTLGDAAAETRAALLAPLLTDPVHFVRAAAAATLADVPDEFLPATSRAVRQAAAREYIASELAAAERPESHVNLANFYLRSGQAATAEVELQTALRLDPDCVPAAVNLADLYRLGGRDAEAEALLRASMARAPRAAAVRHALGLLEARRGRQAAALELLGAAARLDPADARYAYVYGVALHDSGRASEAISVLAAASARSPADRNLLNALRAYGREQDATRSAP